ncbi:MAG: AI-2E family transporter [Actinobacteria bacterium]|nr:AI-2E family transporter [Actinomycetota bacterium]
MARRKAAEDAPEVVPEVPVIAPDVVAVHEVTDGDEVPRWMRKAIALFFAWAVGLLAAYWVLDKLKSLIIMMIIALFLSMAVDAPVKALAKRGWRRGLATGVVLLGAVIITIGFVAAVGSIFIDQLTALVDDTPTYVRRITRFLNDDLGLGPDAKSLIREVESPDGAVRQFAKNLTDSAPKFALGIAEGLLQIVTTLIFAFYLAADGPKFRRAICSRLPRARQEIVLDTWELATEKTGSYLYSRIILATVSAFATWLFLFILDVPSALALGIFVGVVSQFIPTIGTYIAMVLPMLVALLNYPSDALLVGGFLILYNQFENYVLGPRVARFTLKIHPAITIGAVFAGGLLFGGVGAVLALPAAAVIQALVSAYAEEHRVIETELTREPRVRRRRMRWVRMPTFHWFRRETPPVVPPKKAPAKKATTRKKSG